MMARSSPRMKPTGVGSGGLENCPIIERDIAPIGCFHLSDKRRLASPARSHDQDDRGIGEGFLDATPDESLEHLIPEH